MSALDDGDHLVLALVERGAAGLKIYHHVGNYLLNGVLPPNHGQI